MYDIYVKRMMVAIDAAFYAFIARGEDCTSPLGFTFILVKVADDYGPYKETEKKLSGNCQAICLTSYTIQLYGRVQTITISKTRYRL